MIRRTMWWYPVIFCAIAVAQVAGQDSNVVVRTATDPEKEVVVGQKVKLTIDVLAKDAWASLPQLPEIEVRGAIVYSPSSQSLRLSESIDRESYTGQRYEWWVYPRRQGPISIEPIEISVSQKVFGANADTVATTATTDAIELVANYPDGIQSAEELVCATSLKVEQQWTPTATEGLKVGDGVTRTITRTIGGAPAMLLPIFEPDEIEGVRAYPKQPVVKDKSDRGSLVGTRVDAVTYVFESGGSVTFPARKFAWFNERSSELETIDLPERTFEIIAPAVVEDAEVAAAPEQTDYRNYLVPLVIGALLVLLLYYSRGWLKQTYDRLLASPVVKERKAFNQLIAAAQSGNRGNTTTQLYRWMNFPLQDHQAPQLDALLNQFGTNVESSAFQDLMSDSTKWDTAKFIDGCKQIRSNWLKGILQLDHTESAALPDLNP